MRRCLIACIVCSFGFFLLTACGHSVQYGDVLAPSDGTLFDRAKEAFQSNRIDVAAMTLQTMLNTYPDSEHAEEARRILKRIANLRCSPSLSGAEPITMNPSGYCENQTVPFGTLHTDQRLTTND
jgi:hypothetical protein